MKLSIITINRNNADGLRKTIKSVVSQTYTNFEYIIIDGASTDQSVEVIHEYADNIDFWVSEPDSGIYNAMNKGILSSRGEYLLMLNSGDSLTEDVLSKVFAINYDQDILYGNIIWTINHKEAFRTEFNNQFNFKYFVNGSLAHQSTFIKRSLHNKVGLYIEELKIVSDWCFFLLALYKFNCSFYHINSYISISERDGISCLTQNQALIDEERRTFLKLNFNLQYKECLENIKTENELIKYRTFYENSFITKIKRLFKKNIFLKKLNLKN